MAPGLIDFGSVEINLQKYQERSKKERSEWKVQENKKQKNRAEEQEEGFLLSIFSRIWFVRLGGLLGI